MQIFKKVIRHFSPGLGSALKRGVWVWRYKLLTKKIVKRQGLTVTKGPFIGMAYIPMGPGIRVIPKLIGSYEEELRDVISSLLPYDFKVVINIGCSEGYYAVGMARSLHDAIIYAFDSDSKSRSDCLKMAVKNKVDNRVIIGGHCDRLILSQLPLINSLIICDCEGYEIELLDPQIIPDLRKTFLIVEVHDCLNPLTSNIIIQRFGDTHKVSSFRIKTREASSYPSLDGLRPGEQYMSLDENRMGDEKVPGPQWLLLIPNNSI
jgi:hypothetical protein